MQILLKWAWSFCFKAISISILIGALGTILGNAKAWYGRLSLPDIFGSSQLSAILDTAHILRKVLQCLLRCGIAALTWLRIPKKRTGRGSHHNNNNDNNNIYIVPFLWAQWHLTIMVDFKFINFKTVNCCINQFKKSTLGFQVAIRYI